LNQNNNLHNIWLSMYKLNLMINLIRKQKDWIL
jgi:hypothetical protein